MSDPNQPGARAPASAGRGSQVASAETTRRSSDHDVPTNSASSPGAVGSASLATAGSLPTEPGQRPARVSVARRGPRRARLVIKHIDPWTVMKVTFIVTLVILVVVVIATAIIYAVLGKMGVWDQINDLVNQVAPTTASKTLHNPLT
ncbi:MAG: DUF3566 domain-containing protein, partial [Acidothermaceae bacterium]